MAPKDLRKIRMPTSLLMNRVRGEDPNALKRLTPKEREAEAEVARQQQAVAAEQAQTEKAAAASSAKAETERVAKLESAPVVTKPKAQKAKAVPAATPAAAKTPVAVERPVTTEAPAAAPERPAEHKRPLGSATTPAAQLVASAPLASGTTAASTMPAPSGRVAQTSGRFRERFTAPAMPVRAQAYTRNLWLFLWIIIVIGAAQASLYIRPLVGVYVVAGSLASLLWIGIRQERARHLAISVALIPLTLLVSLSLPQTTVFVRTTEVMVIMLLLGLIYQFLFTLDYPTDSTRLRMTRHGYLFAIPLMVVLGQFLGLLGFGLLRHQYDFADSALPLVALGAVIFAISEEIIFRGLIQQRAMLLFHPRMAAILSAVLYAGLTFGHRGSILSPVLGALLGCVLAIVYYKKQNILLTISVNVAAKLTYIGLVAIFVLRH